MLRDDELLDVPNVVHGVSDLEQLDMYVRAELTKLRENPLQHGYPPHRGQEEILAQKRRHRIIVSANRWGKTDVMMREVLWCARGDHPYKRVRMHNQLWVGAPDFPSFKKYHKPAFDRWCPPKWIVGDFNESEKWVKIRRVDGGICTIFFLSYDSPRSKWQGAGVDGIALDEEMPEDIVKECLARIVTTRGWILLTFTPVSGVGWWYDAIFKPAMEGTNKWWGFQASLAEFDEANEAEFNVGESLVPHLTREQIIEFASEYPDQDERMIRVFGAVKGRTGLVYKGFRRRIHWVPRFRIPPDYELWGAIDPGYHGFAASIAAISPQNRIYWVQEYFSQQQTTSTRFKEMAELVRGLRTKEDWRGQPATVVFFVDTEDPQVVLELNTQAALAQKDDAREGKEPVTLAFASLDQGLKARKAGFLRVQQALHPKRDRATPHVPARTWDGSGVPQLEPLRPRPEEGEPQLYFFDDLYSEWQAEDKYHRESRILWEIERYSWKKPPKDSTVRPDDADENSAHGAHGMATLRYLIMTRLGPPEEDKEDQKEELDQFEREIYEDFEEMERRQLDAIQSIY